MSLTGVRSRAAMAKVRITLTVEDSHLEYFDSVAERAVRAGLEIEEAMGFLGIITGAIDADKVDGLQRLKGIASVETHG